MRLILIFIIVPLMEILLLIEIGSRIGTLNTIIVTGILGGYMMRHQGFAILTNIRMDLSQGRMPTGELINGALVLVGGILLLTPGFFTDAMGFVLLVPTTAEPIQIHFQSFWIFIDRISGKVAPRRSSIFFRRFQHLRHLQPRTGFAAARVTKEWLSKKYNSRSRYLNSAHEQPCPQRNWENSGEISIDKADKKP